MGSQAGRWINRWPGFTSLHGGTNILDTARARSSIWSEQRTHNPSVAGSNPAGPTLYESVVQLCSLREGGCTVYPFGHALASVVQFSSLREGGCTVDPFGHALASVVQFCSLREGGCTVDPFGQALASVVQFCSLREDGCTVDDCTTDVGVEREPNMLRL